MGTGKIIKCEEGSQNFRNQIKSSGVDTAMHLKMHSSFKKRKFKK